MKHYQVAFQKRCLHVWKNSFLYFWLFFGEINWMCKIRLLRSFDRKGSTVLLILPRTVTESNDKSFDVDLKPFKVLASFKGQILKKWLISSILKANDYSVWSTYNRLNDGLFEPGTNPKRCIFTKYEPKTRLKPWKKPQLN